jgi:hypothetical protein
MSTLFDELSRNLDLPIDHRTRDDSHTLILPVILPGEAPGPSPGE